MKTFDWTTEELRRLGEEAESFTLELGRFIMTWTDAELELYRTLKHYADVTDAVARAVFSGSRADAMIKFLRSIHHNAPFSPERYADLDFVLVQMALIGGERNDIVHWSSANTISWDEPSTRILTNAERVTRYGKHFKKKIGSATLADMSYDLENIGTHLQRHWQFPDSEFVPWPVTSGVPTTWRYRSP